VPGLGGADAATASARPGARGAPPGGLGRLGYPGVGAPPPPGAEAVEWLLLSNEPVTTLQQAWEKGDWDGLRWPTAEEYHKGQKTGCAIEGPQFTTGGALKPMIGLLSVVAWLLMRLRWEGRKAEAEQQPATAVVPSEWVEALSAWRHGVAC